MITNNASCTREIESNISVTKDAFKNKKYFQRQIGLKFLEETSKLLHLQQVIFMVLNTAQFRKQIKNKWRALKCGAGGRRKSSNCSVVWEMRKY
jgi:hypothetical protein